MVNKRTQLVIRRNINVLLCFCGEHRWQDLDSLVTTDLECGGVIKIIIIYKGISCTHPRGRFYNCVVVVVLVVH